MAEVTVTIAGHPYRMACGEGEEQHIVGLAADLDRRLAALRAHFGEVGDTRLLIMAALTVEDELAAAKQRASTAEQQAEMLQAAQRDAVSRSSQSQAEVAAQIDTAAAAVERLVEALNSNAKGA